ncbi:MAG: type I-E CRISPR-associated protein Cse1/CasA, partial [Nitrosospira sp.]|nr:type I-E CRISPR-associated protein Cse1/CasA [Nitrosospira sp.]
MTAENRFNLVDEPWIPVVDAGRVSLKQLFSHSEYRAVGGNPVQKIALTKLLLAIAQAAYTPEDDDDWASIQPAGLAAKCLGYLDKWHDRFFLYGEKPFLQMPILDGLIKDEKPKSFGPGFYPDVLSENSTILNQFQLERKLGDAEKAVFIITMMNLAFGGKRIHKNIPPLTPNYPGKTVSAKSAPGVGNYVGYLHSYLIGDSVQETIWLNLLTFEKIRDIKIWTNGLGATPWEEMPSGEDCEISRQLKNSYMGCLLAMSRFVFLKDDGIFYIEGIQYPSHKDGWFEPSISLDHGGESIKALWLDVDKRPWRMLTSLLSFLNAGNQKGFECLQIRLGFQRVKLREKPIGVWSGGLKVRGSSGDQSVKQDDDFIESYVILPAPSLIIGQDSDWFSQLSGEMNELNFLSEKFVYNTIIRYFKNQNMSDAAAKDQAK